MRFHLNNFSLVASAFLVASCSADGLIDLSGNGNKEPSSARFKPGEKPVAVDFEKDCGISQDKIDDKNAILLSGSYSSFPIIVEGVDATAGAYRIILTAKVSISANSKVSTVNQNITKHKSQAAGGDIFGITAAILDSVAGKRAKLASGTTTTESLPIAEWLKLTGPNGNPEMKNLLCVVTGAKSIVSNRGEGTLSATFAPALISAVSPLAPVEQMRKEIGPGRTFSVAANVTSIPKTGTTFGDVVDRNFIIGTKTGTVTIRETTPTLSVINEAAGINFTVSTDIAYEVINDGFQPGGPYTVGLPRRSVYLIDSTKKEIRAIMVEEGRPDAKTGQVLNPPVVLVKDK